MISDELPDKLPVFSSPEEARAYWHNETPAERIRAMQMMNREKYGDEIFDRPMPRVLDIETPDYTIRMWMHRKE